MRPQAPSPTRLLWVDLEMTGLDPKVDVIVELAAVVTGFDLDVLAEFDSAVKQPAAVLEERLRSSPWFKIQPPSYGREIVEASLAGQPLEVVEARLLDLIAKHFPRSEAVVLAGNSIRLDRDFIDRYCPDLAGRCHYRMLDVSAWKVYFQGRWGVDYQKRQTHRAVDDIVESIAELKHYLKFVDDQKLS